MIIVSIKDIITESENNVAMVCFIFSLLCSPLNFEIITLAPVVIPMQTEFIMNEIIIALLSAVIAFLPTIFPTKAISTTE
nr:hypothetical protein [Anaerofustis stercorihominis]